MTPDLRKQLCRSRMARLAYAWACQFADPLRFLNAMRGMNWYIGDWRRYAALPGAEPIRLWDTQPWLHDRTKTTAIDTHYFWMSGWAARRILVEKPGFHVDIGSHNLFVNLLSATIPIVFLDYRPLDVRLAGLDCLSGSILALPFANDSLHSLSCLHVAEHIGLGRYGDTLDPLGTRKAAAELQSVLAPGGNLFFALPVGKPRMCFNAHRIHSPETICAYFSGLELVEFSGVHDNGHFVERVRLSEFASDNYACGMFWFRKLGKRI